MNFFGLGAPEFVVVLIIALIIAGPKRMVQWMYVLGRWTAKARALWGEAVDALQRELNESGVDVTIPRDMPTRGSLNRMAQDALKPLAEPVKDVMQDVKKVGDEVNSAAREVKTATQSAAQTPATPVTPTANPAPPLVSDAAQKLKFGNLTTPMPNHQAPKAPIGGFGTWAQVPPPPETPPTDNPPPAQ